MRSSDAVVRLGVLEGDFHWRQHETEDGAVRLEPGQGVTIPRGKMHFPRA